MTGELWQYGYAFYEEEPDGSISVKVGTTSKAPDTLIVCNVAAPNVDQEERQRRVDQAIRDIHMRGYMVTYQKRVHNPIFDMPTEKSTTEIGARPCRTEDEAKAVLGHIAKILSNFADELIATKDKAEQ